MRITAALAIVAIGALTLGAHACEELFRLASTDGGAGAQFGRALDLAGTTAIVAAPKHTVGGAVYVFDATTGEHSRTIESSEPMAGFDFGHAVSLSGTSVLIGEPGPPGEPLAGAAYVFDVETAAQLMTLIAEDPWEFDSFGKSVALSASVAVVGAPTDSEHGEFAGAVYVFDRATGEQLFKLFPAGGKEDGWFGNAIAMTGDVALIGARRAEPYGVRTGAAYLFDLKTGEELALFADPEGGVHDEFGTSVAISGNTALIGAIRDDDAAHDAGSVYLFDISTAKPIGKLLSGDPVYQERFGHDVAVDGATVVVGAHYPNQNDPGSVYLFDLPSGEQTGKLQPTHSAPNDFFGFRVAVRGGTILASTPYIDGPDGQHVGAAYLFSTATCAADLDHDCRIGVADLIAVILGWGTELGDVDGDGTTDMMDLDAVIEAWGPCEQRGE